MNSEIEKFVNYEIAKKLKELGFNLLVNYFYSQDGKLMPRILQSGDESMDFEPDDFYENFNTIAKYEVNGRYQNVFSAPSYQQSIDFLREKYNIEVGSSYVKSAKCWIDSVDFISDEELDYTPEKFDNYYLALESAITKALTLIK